MSVVSETPTRSASGYRIVVPAWWDRIELSGSPDVRDRRVQELVDRQFRGVDDQPLARRRVSTMLADQVRRAHEIGGLELHLSMRAVAGIVLPTSLLIHAVPGVSLESVQGFSTWRNDTLTGVRRRRTVLLEEDSGEPLRTTVVEFYVPVPAGLVAERSFLALTATTLTGVLDEPLVGLFDTIADTLRWLP